MIMRTHLVSDMRQEEQIAGRSINLALSERGRKALRTVGLEDEVNNNNSRLEFVRGVVAKLSSVHDLSFQLWTCFGFYT